MCCEHLNACDNDRLRATTTTTWMMQVCRFQSFFSSYFSLSFTHRRTWRLPPMTTTGPMWQQQCLGPLPQWQSTHTTHTRTAATVYVSLCHKVCRPLLFYSYNYFHHSLHSSCATRTWTLSPRLSSQWVASVATCICIDNACPWLSSMWVTSVVDFDPVPVARMMKMRVMA